MIMHRAAWGPGRAATGVISVPLAHRGLASTEDPIPAAENTLEAFSRSAAAGFGCELDVRLAADGVPVVVHDATIIATDGSRARIDRMTVEELERLGVPTLRAALETLSDRPVIIELKQPRVRVGWLESAVLGVLEADARSRADLAVASFNPWTLAWFARKAPDLLRALNVGRVATRTVLSAAVVRWVRPDVLSVSVDIVGRHRVRTLRRRRPVLCWTVRDAQELGRVGPLVDNVIFEGTLHQRVVAA